MFGNEMLVYSVTLPGGRTEYIKIWASDNEPAMMGCDACIGYATFDPDTLAMLDGGEMDYASSLACYADLSDAVADVLDFAYDGKDVSYAPADVDPELLED